MPTPLPTDPQHLVALLADGAPLSDETLEGWSDAVAAWLETLAQPRETWTEWLDQLDAVSRAGERDTVLSPIFAAARPPLEAAIDAAGTALRLLAGRADPSRFPGARLDALADGELAPLEGDATAVVDAWLDGALGASDAAALRDAVRRPGLWRDAYTQAVRVAVAEVRGGLYDDRCMHVVDAPHALARPLLDTPLPHRATRLRVYAHIDGGTLWLHGDTREVVPGGSGVHRWEDPVLGALETTITRFAVDPLDTLGEAAVTARHLAKLPDHAARALSLTKLLDETVVGGLEEAKDLFLAGQDTEALAADGSFAAQDLLGPTALVSVRPSDVLVEAAVEELLASAPERFDPDTARAWVYAAVDLRSGLDRYCAEHPSHALIDALAIADAACEEHRAALLWVTREEVLRLSGPDDQPTSADWWGLHEALEAAAPRHLIADALASLEAE